jgi:hypothetical protein
MIERIEYLESLIPKDLDIDKKYFDKFSKYARYLGNGVYTIDGIVSTNTRELFLMYCLFREKIQFKQY